MNPFRRWLLKATDRVHARLAGTNSITEGQEELERYVKVLTYYLTHDLRAPLRTIQGFAIALQQDLSEGSPERDYASAIAEAARRMALRIDDVDMFDRLCRIQLSNPTPMAAGIIFIEAKEVFNGLAEAQSIRLNYEPSTDTQFPGHRYLLMRVLSILIQNAAEAIGQDGTITLRARTGKARLNGRKKEAVFMEVEDTGPGIQEAVAHRLFHPFFSTKSHGIGLGLATAARIVSKHHGGAIEFKTKLGQGTTFTVILPAYKKS